MNTSVQIAPGFSADRPRVVAKITRADLQLLLPRLDDKCLDDDGFPSAAKRAKLDEQIARYRWVYDLGGRIHETKVVKGKGDEPGVRFVGKFKAHVNPLLGGPSAGMWFVSGRAHVPRFFEESMYAEVLAAKKEDPNATLDFMIRVGIKPSNPDKASTTGYEWTVETLISMDLAEDPVQALFERAKVQTALAAPVATETNGAAPAVNGAAGLITTETTAKAPGADARTRSRSAV